MMKSKQQGDAMDASTQQAAALLNRLIEFPSVSSTSNRPISDDVTERLNSLGFEVEQTTYLDERGIEKVNLVACREPRKPEPRKQKPEKPESSHREVQHEQIGTDPKGGLAYFSHTDVVPVSPWTGPNQDSFQANSRDSIDEDAAFRPVLSNGRIYGRGACDMKGSIAAMMTAAASISIDDQFESVCFFTFGFDVLLIGIRCRCTNRTADHDRPRE